MFQQIVNELDGRSGGGLSALRYHLRRHIDLDGGEHGPAALRRVAALCGEEPERWRSAAEAAHQALVAGKALWDGMLAALNDS